MEPQKSTNDNKFVRENPKIIFFSHQNRLRGAALSREPSFDSTYSEEVFHNNIGINDIARLLEYRIIQLKLRLQHQISPKF